jgi:rhombotail lipoprotein
MKSNLPTISAVLLAAFICLLNAGCVGFGRAHHSQATSVMQFLYSDNDEHVDTPTIPVLHLPLRVGIAFVPPANGPAYAPDRAITAASKTMLLDRVAAAFKGLPYVKSIETIPSSYLRPAGGFENLDQLRRLFGVDVIALVAYDQTQLTNEGFLSLSYWTVAGAYVIHGERNDTETLMEAAVYDIASRKLLFRAPGVSQVKANSTLINNSEELQADAQKGFDLATADMIGNLHAELDQFKQRVKESPSEYSIVRSPGYTGAGAFDGLTALVLAATAAIGLRRRRTAA